MINFIKTRKKLLIAILLGLLIIVLLVLPGKKPNQKDQTPPSQINIPALNPSINPQQAADFKELVEPKKVTVFEPVKYTQEELAAFFKPIADELKFPNSQQTININKIPHFYWENSSNSLTVNLNIGSFSSDLKKNATSSSQISEADALLFAKNWLVNHKLIDDKTDYETTYYQDINYELSQTDNAIQVDVYGFSFFPMINNLPVFPTESFDAPVSVTVNKFGNITSLYYRLPALFFANQPKLKTSQKPILSPKQIEAKITNKEAIIFSVNDDNGNFVPSTENLNNLTYTKTELGYSNDFSLGYFVPVFRLTGTASLDNGNSVIVTAYLPALAE